MSQAEVLDSAEMVKNINTVCSAQHDKFMAVDDYDPAALVDTAEGKVMKVGDDEIPVMDIVFPLMIVQPGHVTQNKEFKDSKGKIIIQYNDKNPTSPENEVVDEVFLMPVSVVERGFRLFNSNFDDKDNNKLLCFSKNGLYPHPNAAEPRNSICAVVDANGRRDIKCPMAMWENGKVPQCREYVVLGAIDMIRKIPVTLQLHGVGMKAYNALGQAYTRAKNVARLKKKSINDYVIKFTLEDSGPYVTPKFDLIEYNEETGSPRDLINLAKYYRTTVFKYAPVKEYSVGQAQMAAAVISATDEDIAKSQAALGMTV